MWIAFFVGLFLGAMVGATVMALVCASRISTTTMGSFDDHHR
jgi:gas vesicle protein